MDKSFLIHLVFSQDIKTSKIYTVFINTVYTCQQLVDIIFISSYNGSMVNFLFTLILSALSDFSYSIFQIRLNKQNNNEYCEVMPNDSGLKINMLQKYLFIPLDIFKEKVPNKLISIDSKLEAWLSFLSSDDPEIIVSVINQKTKKSLPKAKLPLLKVRKKTNCSASDLLMPGYYNK